MESMVEKVARAICNEMQYDWDNPAVSQFRGTYVRMAKAAIEAMRIPTEDMLQAGYGHHYRLDTKLGRSKAELDYDDMIRSALKEPA